MDKYVRVDWPESQEWMERDCVDVFSTLDGPVVFVPEELYNQVKGK